MQIPIHAAEPVVYTLDPLLVTATRYEKKDLDIPSTTAVITQEQIIDRGAQTAQEALRFATGVIYKANPTGENGGEFLIRGKRRGTLVMVDGISINVRNGYSDLSNIPAEDIQQIEIIRGGGAVQYGSDATGGVINIITKKNKTSSVSTAFGNFGRQRHQIQIGSQKFDFGFIYDKFGNVNNISQPSIAKDPLTSKFFNFHGGEKFSSSFVYRFTDALSFRIAYSDYDYVKNYNYANKKNAVGIKTPTIYDWRDIHNEDLQATMQYSKNDLKANIHIHRYHSNTKYTYWNYKTKESTELHPTLPILDKKYITEYVDKIISADIQKTWERKNDVFLVGLSAQRDYYHITGENKPKWAKDTGIFDKYELPNHSRAARSAYSIFASWEHKFNDLQTLIISGRQTWTGASPDGTNFNQFTPQLQYLHKINEKTSLFASYGESFTLPSLSDVYGKGGATLANKDLEPETGKHYEIGLKHQSHNAFWKLSLFKSDVKNFIRMVEIKNTDLSQSKNEDTKNKGIELSVDFDHGQGLSSSWGIVVQNPFFYDTRDAHIKKGWQRDYGRVQFNGGITYNKEKWTLALNASYLGQRVLSSYQKSLKNMLVSTIHVAYRPNKDQEIFLDIDNFLDRQDITSHVSSLYNSQPRNFLLGYRYKF